MEDWQIWGCDEDGSEDPDGLPVAEVVRFEPIAQISDVAVLGDSTYGPQWPDA